MKYERIVARKAYEIEEVGFTMPSFKKYTIHTYSLHNSPTA